MSRLNSEKEIQQRVEDACLNQQPLSITGGNTKSFYGHPVEAQPLSLANYQGIINYQPSELVITARAGTLLTEIEATLALKNQMLACEPPGFGENATWGGMIATGLSGSRRPFTGAVRDFVLGTKIINGRAEVLKFGGEVMKNVAGYDLSRLMAGSLGCLGVLLEASLKVLPKPVLEMTIAKEMFLQEALEEMTLLASQWLPITGVAYYNKRLYIRFSGGESVVQQMAGESGGEIVDNIFWDDLKEQHLDFFKQNKPLWRISVPPACPALDIKGDWLIDWSGGLRWLSSEAPATEIFQKANRAHGHATQFNKTFQGEHLFDPSSGVVKHLHATVKKALDPQGIFNPGRMYPGL